VQRAEGRGQSDTHTHAGELYFEKVIGFLKMLFQVLYAQIIFIYTTCGPLWTLLDPLWTLLGPSFDLFWICFENFSTNCLTWF
jgi:hypothetical protein